MSHIMVLTTATSVYGILPGTLPEEVTSDQLLFLKQQVGRHLDLVRLRELDEGQPPVGPAECAYVMVHEAVKKRRMIPLHPKEDEYR